jgi:prepilin-type N-terminal cleavage/methylation domain-containing protein
MEPAMMRAPHILRTKKKRGMACQRGFGLLEVMISITILTIGLLAVAGMFGTVLASTQWSQEDLIAKQKALEALESIYVARDTQQITFAQIANVSNGGIFVDGYGQMLQAGPDGLVGTADDANFAGCPSGVECFRLPGPDGILGTADDTTMSLATFQRQILITQVLQQPGNVPNPNLKHVTVNVQYTKPGMKAPRVYTTNALISAFR